MNEVLYPVRIKADLYTDLKWIARDLNISIQDLVNAYLQDRINQNQK